MELVTSQLIVYAFIVLIGVFITRLIFGIPTIIKNLKKQTWLLTKLLETKGFTEAEIREELKKFDL